jgi:hypothetical protein
MPLTLNLSVHNSSHLEFRTFRAQPPCHSIGAGEERSSGRLTWSTGGRKTYGKCTAGLVPNIPNTVHKACTAHAWCCLTRQTCRLAVRSASMHAMRNIARLIRSRAGDRDEVWHSAQARTRHTGSSAYVWRDYAMIRRLARRCRFQ